MGILLEATAIEASDGIAGSNTPGAFFPRPFGIADEMQFLFPPYRSLVNLFMCCGIIRMFRGIPLDSSKDWFRAAKNTP